MHRRRTVVASVMMAFALLAALSPALPVTDTAMPRGRLTVANARETRAMANAGVFPSPGRSGASMTTADGAPIGMELRTLPDWFSLDSGVLNGIASQAGELRQLDCETVPVHLMNRDELREMLVQDSEEDLNEIDATQELLILLDLLDEGQNLRDIMVEAYTQDVLGFYDADKDELYVVSETGDLGPLDRLTLAHEYAHAIQDQHFDLTSLGGQNDDSEASSALDALIEGDATVVQALYFWSYLDPGEQAAIGEMTAEPGKEPGAGVPPVIQQTMMFPYQYGLVFVMALIEEGKWKAVNDAYGDPPKSTEQIMHPEKYIENRDDPLAVTLPDMAAALRHGWSELDSDVFGEFSLKLYLEAFLDSSEAETAAAGWGGDRYTFLEDDAGAKVFVLSTEWDTESDAEEFYQACVDRAHEKGGSGKRGNAEGSKASARWESEGLSYRFALDGERVHLVIAPDAKTAQKAMAAASGSAKSSNVWLYVGVGVGLACLVCVLGFVVLLVRRRRNMRLAAESAVSQGGPSP